MEKEIAQLKKMLSRAQRKRSNVSYCVDSEDDDDINNNDHDDNDREWKELPRQKVPSKLLGRGYEAGGFNPQPAPL